MTVIIDGSVHSYWLSFWKMHLLNDWNICIDSPDCAIPTSNLLWELHMEITNGKSPWTLYAF